jgi:hypothetical protein
MTEYLVSHGRLPQHQASLEYPNRSSSSGDMRIAYSTSSAKPGLAIAKVCTVHDYG